MTRSIYGWDLPPGCTLDDIERAYGGDGESEGDVPATTYDPMCLCEACVARTKELGIDPFLPNYDGEITTTGALDAIINDPLVDEEDGLTGKPYTDDETPLTEEEAQEVLEEMRKAVSSDGAISLASAVANELGLEVEA